MSACAASCGVANDFGGKGDVGTCCPANAATARIVPTQTATSTKAMIFEIFNVIRVSIFRGLDLSATTTAASATTSSTSTAAPPTAAAHAGGSAATAGPRGTSAHATAS